jgi:hypothetical protein
LISKNEKTKATKLQIYLFFYKEKLVCHIKEGTQAEGFKNLVLQNISRAKTEEDEYTGWRKLHNDELPCFHYLPNITMELKSMRRL